MATASLIGVFTILWLSFQVPNPITLQHFSLLGERGGVGEGGRGGDQMEGGGGGSLSGVPN